MITVLGYAEAMFMVFLAGLVVWAAGYAAWKVYGTLLWDRRGYCPKCHQAFDVRTTGSADVMYGPYVTAQISCSRDGTKSTTYVHSIPDL